MAVRLHLGAMAEEGFIEAVETRASRGRPARVFALTSAAHQCFPDRSGVLAISVLEEVEAVAGREVVVRALERRARRVGEAWRAAMEGKGPADRVRMLAGIRDSEGYLAEADGRTGTLPDLVERHCPIASIAQRWPEVCRIEEDLFRSVLGASLERKDHMLTGGSCCRYRLGGEV
jgi:predicted ArsR family transcriptional regulator